MEVAGKVKQSMTAREALRSKPSSHFYAGFVSGLTSAVLLQPLELLKTRVQQQKGLTLSASYRSLSGVGELWRGTLPSALRTSVGSALYFTSLNAVRTFVHTNNTTNNGDVAGGGSASSSYGSSKLPRLSMHANLLSGSMVRGLVGLATMPFTVIKVRYESSIYRYTSLIGAVKSVYQHEGVAGFFKGYGVTFARDAPYAGLYVLFYEKSKELLNSMVSKQLSSSTKETRNAAAINSSAAAMSAGLATTITAPFDTIKTRVQLDPARYKSFVHAAKLIVTEDGFLHLFDGLSLRLTRKAFSAGISWCIYEELIKKFHA